MNISDWHNMGFMPGRDYYPIGNGMISCIIQVDNSGINAPFTLLLQDPGCFDRSRLRKKDTYLFDPVFGVEKTALTISIDSRRFQPVHSNMKIRWADERVAPTVEFCWWAGPLRIMETLFAAVNEPVIYRRVSIENRGEYTCDVEASCDYKPNPELFGEIVCEPDKCFAFADSSLGSFGLSMPYNYQGLTYSLRTSEEGIKSLVAAKSDFAPGDKIECDFAYFIAAGKDQVPYLAERIMKGLSLEAKLAEEKAKKHIRMKSSDPECNHILSSAVRGISMCSSNQGHINAGIWEYNAEWVRDSSLIALGMLCAGMEDETQRVLSHILEVLVDDRGRTIIGGGFVDGRHEQFDQAGQLLYTLGQYCLWTDNKELIARHWRKIVAVAERLVNSPCRDPKTGLYRNEREFWERSGEHGIQEGYELAYQVWPIAGLKSFRTLAEIIESASDIEKASCFDTEAERIWSTVITDDKFSLIEDGRFIKRKGPDGSAQVSIAPPHGVRFPEDIPLGNDRVCLINPDTSVVFPILLDLADPRSVICKNTLDSLEQLWNLRWDFGGYDRYHTSSEPDTPGPWMFGSLFAARANHICGNRDRSLKVVKWLCGIQGGKAGAWHEYIPTVRTNAEMCGILVWPWAEMTLLFVREVLGIRPYKNYVEIKPALFPEMGITHVSIHIKGMDLELQLDGKEPSNNKVRKDGSKWLHIPLTGCKLFR